MGPLHLASVARMSASARNPAANQSGTVFAGFRFAHPGYALMFAIYAEAGSRKRPNVNSLLIDDVGPESMAATVIYGRHRHRSRRHLCARRDPGCLA